MKSILHRFTACHALACLTATSGLCCELDELKVVALELKAAIERRDRDGVMKYIHGWTCFHDDCYGRDEIAEMLKDDTSDPSAMLFFGEFSLRTLLLKNQNVYMRIMPLTWSPGSWQILWINPDHPGLFVVYFYVKLCPSGWKVTTFFIG